MWVFVLHQGSGGQGLGGAGVWGGASGPCLHLAPGALDTQRLCSLVLLPPCEGRGVPFSLEGFGVKRGSWCQAGGRGGVQSPGMPSGRQQKPPE